MYCDKTQEQVKDKQDLADTEEFKKALQLVGM